VAPNFNGTLDLSRSFVAPVGGNTGAIPVVITSHPAPTPDRYPTVSASVQGNGVAVNWQPVPGAQGYQVFVTSDYPQDFPASFVSEVPGTQTSALLPPGTSGLLGVSTLLMGLDGQNHNVLSHPLVRASPGPLTTLTLSPITQTAVVGSSAPVTATVTDSAGVGVQGFNVSITVLNGPDAGKSAALLTNSRGQATFVVANHNVPGTDVVQGSFTDANQTLHTSNIASVIFQPLSVDVNNDAGQHTETTIIASMTDSSTLLAGAISQFPTPRQNGAYSGTVVAYQSHDRGATWATTELSPAPAAFNCVKVNGGQVFASDPFVASSRKSGLFLYAYLSVCSGGSPSPSTEIDVARSADGVNWTTSAVALEIGTTFHDKPMVTVDNTTTSPTYGRIYVAWVANVAPGTIHLALKWSDDEGSTWSHEVALDHLGSRLDFAPYVAVQGEGIPAVIWYDYGSDSIQFAVASGLVGSKLSPQFKGNPTSLGRAGMSSIHFLVPPQASRGLNPDPSLIIAPTQANVAPGRLYALWTTATGPAGPIGGAGTSVVLRASSDGGRTWTGPVTINDDTSGTGSAPFDFFAQEAVDRASGTLHVSFYSTRLDHESPPCTPTCPGPSPTVCVTDCKADIFYAVSADGGKTFSMNQRITNSSSDESINSPQHAEGQYGDYESIAVEGGVAHPIWIEHDAQSHPDEQVFTASIGSS